MKRILAFFLTISLIATILPMNLTVSSATGATATMSSATAERGEEVDLTITLANAPKVKYMLFELTLPEGITLLSGEWLPSRGDVQVPNLQGGWFTLAAEDTNGAVVSLKFKVEEDAACGSYKINFIFFVDATAEKDANVTEVAGVITVHSLDNACDAICNDCGEVRENPHDFEWVVDEAENCGDNGTKHEECTVCHTTQNENTVIPATGDHSYDNACDAICNVCKQERDVPDHLYENACETMCLLCGGERVITHSYSSVWLFNGIKHWHECTVCGDKIDIEEHKFDNACDTTCNTCGCVREITHDYSDEWTTDSSNHWHECSVCGDKINVADHIYDNTCDTMCSICDDVREITHDFEWVIDEAENCGVDGTKHEECAVCHTTQNEETVITATGDHSYDNACDVDCNVCDQVREITHNYSDVWENDSSSHWRECTVCGDKTGVTEHGFDNACDTTCDTCEYVRETTHQSGAEWLCDETHHWRECTVCGDKTDASEHSVENGVCTVCGAEFYTPGDLDGEEGVSANDAIYLLYRVFFGEEQYPVDQPCDFNGDSTVDANDAIYLLYHVFFGDETYPLN